MIPQVNYLYVANFNLAGYTNNVADVFRYPMCYPAEEGRLYIPFSIKTCWSSIANRIIALNG